MTTAVLAAAAACAVLAAAALLRRRGRGRAAELGVEIVPVAAPDGPRLRIRVTNHGTATARDVTLRLRPAPPGVAIDRIRDAVSPAAAATAMLAGPLAPGSGAETEAACPLQPGPHYRRAFGLDASDHDPLYALPVDALLHTEMCWRERPGPGPARRRRRTIVGGRRFGP